MIDYSSRQLRAFLLVAQYRSFARASGRLLITPSGLSVLIRELERQVGARLFDRTTRHVALTPAGTALLRVVQPALQNIDDGLASICRSSADAKLTLKLGAVPLVASSVVPQAIRAFRKKRPRLAVNIVDRDAAAIVQEIESGRLDAGLGVFFSHLRGITRTPLFRFTFLLIRSAGDRAVSQPATWASLKKEALISLDPTYPLQQAIDKHLARAGVVRQPVLALSSLNTVIAMVEAGQGVGIIPSFWLAACAHRSVVAAPLTHPSVRLDFLEIRQSGRRLPEAADEFLTLLRSAVVNWAERIGAVR